MRNHFIEPVKLADKFKLTNLTDPGLIPQLIKGPAQSVVEQIEGDVTKYIQTTLVSLNIDQDILEKQTAEIYRLNEALLCIHKKEEAGLLIDLPYNVGDRYWIAWDSSILGKRVPVYMECMGYSITITSAGTVQIMHACEVFEPTNISKFDLRLFKDCAKTFPTQEECIKYIESLGGGEDE